MRQQSFILGVVLLVLTIFSGCEKEEAPVVTPEPQFSSFTLIEDNIDGQPILVIGSQAFNLVLSFYTQLPTGETLEFIQTGEDLPAVMGDTEGNVWNAFGEAISGPRVGQRLRTPTSMMAYWFAIAAQYPGMDIYEGPASSATAVPLNDPDWNISTDSVAWGSSWDAIQSLDYPAYIEYKARDYIAQDYLMDQFSLVSGVRIGNETKAYPHLIMNWHEIINDRIDGQEISLAWCPLAGTATVWDRSNNPAKYSVAGLLHNNNLMMFDRGSESIWSQIRGECVYGDRKGELASSIQMVETSWATWQRLVKDPIVLSEETGVTRDYATDDFEFYRNTEDYLFYPLDHLDKRLPEKERVHVVIINGIAKAYRFSSLAE